MPFSYRMRALLALVSISAASVSAFAPARNMVPVAVHAPSAMSPFIPAPRLNQGAAKITKLSMAAASAAMEDPSEGEASSSGEGTITALLFNLVKSIVGAGVLSLPAGKYEYNDTHGMSR